MFLFKINQRHLRFILKAFLDCQVSYFQSMENIAFMWVHEVSRIVLDRFSDPTEQVKIYDLVK